MTITAFKIKKYWHTLVNLKELTREYNENQRMITQYYLIERKLNHYVWYKKQRIRLLSQKKQLLSKIIW